MTVYFIGAGPGDPNLLTLKANEVLKKCQFIIYAGSLIPQPLISRYTHAKCVDSANMTLEQTHTLIVQIHQKGLNIARLQSGDLSIYSAVDEQIKKLKADNIPYELIPGISAFSAFSTLLKQEFSVPEITQTIILTRFGKNIPLPEKETLTQLAKHLASLVIHLGILHCKAIAQILSNHYGAQHPIAIGYQITYPDQDYLLTTVENMHQAVKAKKWKKTALIFISPILKHTTSTRSNLYHPNFSHLYRQGSKKIPK